MFYLRIKLGDEFRMSLEGKSYFKNVSSLFSLVFEILVNESERLGFCYCGVKKIAFSINLESVSPFKVVIDGNRLLWK